MGSGGPPAGVACGDGADRGQTAPLSVPPAGTTPTATAVEAAPASAPLETIADVFACINPGAAGGLAEGREERPLIRHDLDLEQFPEARCNDGTAAVFYFRPHEGEENRDRWVVQLQGGGGCRDAESCAKRWCSVDTNFGATQMSSRFAPSEDIDGKGILRRRQGNPWGDYNQVFVRYCTSDTWSGTNANILATAPHPRTGEDVAYVTSFLGARVVDAVISTLSADPVAPLVYDRGESREMPDLDDAQFVVLAGASAGGGGTVRNLDHFADTLRETNTLCQGSDCPLDVRGLIDSAYGPAIENLGFEETEFCTAFGLCTAEAFLRRDTLASAAFRGDRTDQSCTEWHTANAPGTEWQCTQSHVIEEHLTTPFFLRMGLTDSLISRNTMERHHTDEKGAAIDLQSFARIVRDQLIALPGIQATAHEAEAIAIPVGIFGPSCSKHETLRCNEATYEVTVELDGVAYDMFDVMLNWLAGDGPAAVVTADRGSDHCP